MSHGRTSIVSWKLGLVCSKWQYTDVQVLNPSCNARNHDRLKNAAKSKNNSYTSPPFSFILIFKIRLLVSEISRFWQSSFFCLTSYEVLLIGDNCRKQISLMSSLYLCCRFFLWIFVTEVGFCLLFLVAIPFIQDKFSKFL